MRFIDFIHCGRRRIITKVDVGIMLAACRGTSRAVGRSLTWRLWRRSGLKSGSLDQTLTTWTTMLIPRFPDINISHIAPHLNNKTCHIDTELE